MNPHAIVAKIKALDKEIQKEIAVLQRSRAAKVKARYQRRIDDSNRYRADLVEELAEATGGKKPPKYWPEPAAEVGDYVVFVSSYDEMVELVSVKSLMGPICWESPGTPYTCSVQSETYWSS